MMGPLAATAVLFCTLDNEVRGNCILKNYFYVLVRLSLWWDITEMKTCRIIYPF